MAGKGCGPVLPREVRVEAEGIVGVRLPGDVLVIGRDLTVVVAVHIDSVDGIALGVIDLLVHIVGKHRVTDLDQLDLVGDTAVDFTLLDSRRILVGSRELGHLVIVVRHIYPGGPAHILGLHQDTCKVDLVTLVGHRTDVGV